MEADTKEMAQIPGRIEQFKRIKYKTAKGIIYSPKRYGRRKSADFNREILYKKSSIKQRLQNGRFKGHAGISLPGDA